MSHTQTFPQPASKHLTVGVIGMGRMGLPIAQTLKRTGFDVLATSRSQASRVLAAAEGITVLDTPREIAENAKLIFISVFDTAALKEVIQGEDGLISELQVDSVVADLGTSDISETRKLAALIEEAGAFYIDAPVSGGTRGAAEGKLTIMAGGQPSAIDLARPVFEALGRLNHMGPNGAGQSTKAINQLVLGQNLIAVAEGMALAQQLGLDPRQVREALIGGFAESRVLVEHGRRMVEEDFTPGGSIAVFSKDLRLVRSLLRQLNLEFSGLSNAHDQYEHAMQAGLADRDQSAIITTIVGRTNFSRG